MSTASVMPSSHLILWCALLLLLSIFPSIKDINESAVCIRWPKYWSFSINPSNEYSGLISLKIYWFDLLAVQGTFRSLLQHHSLKASILCHSAFFTVSQAYTTTGKTMLLLLSCFSHVRLCATPQTAAHQASASLGFSRQEHWSGLPFPSPMHESEKWKWSRSVASDSSDPMDCSLPGSSVHGIFQAKVTGVGCHCSLDYIEPSLNRVMSLLFNTV